MAFERAEVSSRGQVPKLDRVVVAPADQHFPIGGNSEATDPVLVAGKGFPLDRVRHLEQLDGGVSAAGEQEFGVRGEGHGADPVVHRFLKYAVIRCDVVAAGFSGILLVLPPVTIVQHLLLAAREHFPNLDLADVGPAGEMDTVG